MKNKIGTMGGQVVVVFLVAMCGTCMAIPVLAQQSPTTPTPAVVTAGTNTAGDAIGRQMAAIQEAVEAVDEQGKPMVDPSYRQNMTRMLTRIQRNIESKDFRNALQACDSLTADSASPSFRKMGRDLYAAIALQIKADQARLVNDAREMLIYIPAACAAATNQADLQALNVKVQQAQNSMSRMSDNENPEFSILRQNLQNAQELVRLSMGCLAAESSGDLARALESMNQMMSMSSYAAFTYGRMDNQLQNILAPKRNALILKLMNQPAASDDSIIKIVNDQMAGVDSLDKLIELRRRLMPVSSIAASRMGYSTTQAEIQSLLTDIQLLEVWRDALQAGQYGTLLQGQSNPGPYYTLSRYSSFPHHWRAIINRYQNQMRAQALAGMFELKGFEAKEGQTPEQTLLQAADKAAGGEQWEMVAVYLEAYKVASFGSQNVPAALTDQINACRNFIAAQNYEKAGDIERATASYLAVLSTPSKRAPVAAAFKELARLRKDRPDIFEKARQASVVTSVPAPAVAAVP